MGNAVTLQSHCSRLELLVGTTLELLEIKLIWSKATANQNRQPTAYLEFLSHPRSRSFVRYTRDTLSVSTRTARQVCGKGLHKPGKRCTKT